MSDFFEIGMQLYRGYHNIGERWNSDPALANAAEFISSSSSILKLVTIEAASAANLRSSAAVYTSVVPLLQTLSGVSLASNAIGDAARLADVIAGGDEASINEAAFNLLLGLTGALLVITVTVH